MRRSECEFFFCPSLLFSSSIIFVGILEMVADWMNSELDGSNALVSEQGSRKILYQKVCSPI
jgi:hypothetical protein